MTRSRITVFLKTGGHIRSEPIEENQLEEFAFKVAEVLTGSSQVLNVSPDPADSDVFSVHIPRDSINYVTFSEVK